MILDAWLRGDAEVKLLLFIRVTWYLILKKTQLFQKGRKAQYSTVQYSSSYVN